MKVLKSIALVLVLAPAFSLLQAKPKKTDKLPAVFDQASYFYVEAIDGDEFDPRLYPEDRQAIANVEQAIQGWHRYRITVKREQADLIFVVRKGRAGQAHVGVDSGGPQGDAESRSPMDPNSPGNPNNPSNPNGHNNPNYPEGLGVEVGAGVGSPDDLLEVYFKNPEHASGTLIWRRTEADGLDKPTVSLVRKLKEEIDQAYPQQTASQTQKP